MGKHLSIADTALLGRASASTPIIPVTAGLVLQLDANAITGLVNNDPVSVWSDTSGAGYHFEQTTAGLEPLYKTNVQNGRPGVDFDGVDNYMRSTSGTSATGSTAYTMFVALKLDTSAATAGIFRNGDTDGFGLLVSGAGDREILHRSVAALDDAACTTSAEYWSAVRTAAPLARLYVNGVNQAITNDTSGCNAATTFSIVGAFSAALGFYMDGKIFEVLLYNTNLSDPDRVLVEAYLAAKWGI